MFLSYDGGLNECRDRLMTVKDAIDKPLFDVEDAGADQGDFSSA